MDIRDVQCETGIWEENGFEMRTIFTNGYSWKERCGASWSKWTIIQTNNAGNPLRRGFRRCLFFMIEIAKQRVLANFAWPAKNMEESFESGQIKDWELTIRQSWYIFILINDNVIDYLM